MSELRVVLIDVISPHKHSSDALKDLAELQLLVKTFGGVDIVQIIQHRTAPDQATFIGSGKVQELILIVKQEKISHLIINSIVSPGQIFNLTKILWSVNPNIQVWDRVDLILNIFEKHARSAEAKLQIEIARMQHMKFRIYGLGGTVLSRQAGGIGTRGIGETNIERMRQHFKKQIKKKKEQLEKLVAHHQRQFLRRYENGIKTISIIGYTNAGKTSLFNLLTGKNKQVEDALFVTLDSTVSSLRTLEGSENVVISDTIGFIQNLPPSLIESFKSTLLEAIEADILLHIIDLSDEKMEEKIKAVEVITNDLNLSTKKQFYVFNKLDRLNGKVNTIVPKLQEKYLDFSPLFISVKTSEGIEQLKKQLLQVI